MNLKPLVNNRDLWQDFLQEIDIRIESVHRQMEQVNTAEELYRLQGEAKALRSFKFLREKVNNG